MDMFLRNGIKDQIKDECFQAILPCNVTDSNPPARHFNFYRDNVHLTDEKKYQQVIDVVENAAYLKVPYL